MALKLRATHLAPPAYAHLKEYVVLSGSWQIGSISEERAGKGWFWSLGVGTPFDLDKVRMHGSHAKVPPGCWHTRAAHEPTLVFQSENIAAGSTHPGHHRRYPRPRAGFETRPLSRTSFCQRQADGSSRTL
jgi:hypothetical protein